MESVTPRTARHNLTRRWLVLAFGAVVWWWLSHEGADMGLTAALGWFGAALLVRRPRRLSLRGLLIGAAASLLTAALMFFKNAYHAHLFLDFPPQMLLAILERLPVWSLAGALVALGWTLLRDL